MYTFFALPNFPDAKAKFINDDEKATIIESLPKTQPQAGAKTWNSDQVKALLKDPTMATFTLVWVCHAIGGWGVGTVLPTVIYEMGLTDTAIAQLMTMVRLPPRTDPSRCRTDDFMNSASICIRMLLPGLHWLADTHEEGRLLGCGYWM